MRIEKHKYVQFRYQITDSNGSLLERSDVPVNYLHGHDSGLMEKLEQRLEGKTTGDIVAVTLLPEEGFGQSDPALLY
ncbi:MAG: FKBP-type peptidyl-prolyl cis-trans isomerase, partial [Gammaproteobacteria bacterium]|nr:FKBP-type peptidyl-prolyl cis-trans isomerase [Gammaproteobacteria bacterium]